MFSPSLSRDATFESPLHLKLSVFMSLTPDERRFLRELQAVRVSCKRGRNLIGQSEPFDSVYVLIRGWAMRHMVLRSGVRQVMNFVLPGDFVCFNAIIFEKATRFVTCITDCELAAVSEAQILRLFETHPRLASGIAWCNALEERMLAQHLASIGRRSASERIAHLLLELFRRLSFIGLTTNQSMSLPITRDMFADAMGLSAEHVSRVFQELRSRGLIHFRSAPRGKVTIVNMQELADHAGFERGYLYFLDRHDTRPKLKAEESDYTFGSSPAPDPGGR